MSALYISADPVESMDAITTALGGAPTITINISSAPAKAVQGIGYAVGASIKKNFFVTEKIVDARILINIAPTGEPA